MASTSFWSQIINSCCQADLEILGYKYKNVKPLVLNELCRHNDQSWHLKTMLVLK